MTEQSDDPPVVTALHYDEPAIAADLAAWCGGTVQISDAGEDPVIWVPTVKGPRPAALGDWIVRRGPRDHYPSGQALFEARHEPLV